jgi:hypothetical protein
MAEEIKTAEELSVRLAEVLSTGSLYRKFTYSGYECHTTDTRAFDSPRFGLLPISLKMYCGGKHCSQETLWAVVRDRQVYFRAEFFHQREYRCRNCGSNNINYWFIWQENRNENHFFIKVAQWPPLAIEPSREVAAALGLEDAELYKKALIAANFSHGIGAIAYFRRVIENKVNALIDLIAEAAKTANFELEQLQRIEEIKKDRHVDVRIGFASKILPLHLRPGGHNPLDKLYAAASGGLHGETDEECLVIFEEARFVFEYLFKNLTVTNAEAQEYIKRLSAPSSKRQ